MQPLCTTPGPADSVSILPLCSTPRAPDSTQMLLECDVSTLSFNESSPCNVQSHLAFQAKEDCLTGNTVADVECDVFNLSLDELSPSEDEPSTDDESPVISEIFPIKGSKTQNRTPLSFHNYSKPPYPVPKPDSDKAEVLRLRRENKMLRNRLRIMKKALKTQTKRFSYKVIEGNDKKTRQYTGFPSWEFFITMFKRRIEPKAKLLATNHQKGTSQWYKGAYKKKPGPKRPLELVDEFLLVMMRLRLDLLEADLAERFSISLSQVSRILSQWLPCLARCLRKCLKSPTKEQVQAHMPMSFVASYPKTRVIIDCFEIFIERPTSVLARQQTWSTYKHHNTAKVLIGITPEGVISFLSEAWGGRASDKHMTIKSGFLETLDPYDEVMADRGFTIGAELAQKLCTLNMPPFTQGKSQLSRGEVHKHRKISSLRIHVERAIERVKNFKILQKVYPLNQIHHLNDIITICAAVVNLWPPIVTNPIPGEEIYLDELTLQELT